MDYRDPRELAQNHPPIVQIVQPSDSQQFSQKLVPVKCEIRSVNGLPIQAVTLLHNGSVAKVFQPTRRDQVTMTIEHEIELQPGTNDLTVIAANARSSSRGERVAIELTSKTAATRPDVHVLAIGISDYENAGSGFENLPRAATDAQAIVDAVLAQKDGKLYRTVHTKLLRNEQATRQGIQDGFQWLVDNVQAGDVAMIFVAAHGFTDSRDNFYLGTYDVVADRGTFHRRRLAGSDRYAAVGLASLPAHRVPRHSADCSCRETGHA